MKINFSILFFISTLFLFVFQSSAQDFDFSKYKPRTLSEIIELNPIPADKDAKRQLLVSGDWFYSQVRVKYIGTSRPVPVNDKEILKAWKASFKIPDETFNLFEKEYLFRECDKEYWIPVQKQVAEFFPKELKEGEMITLYLFFAGGLKIGEKQDVMFLVNEFEK